MKKTKPAQPAAQKTPGQWLEGILGSSLKLHDWLQRQYVGETLAAQRIAELAARPDLPAKAVPVLQKIAADESAHASWIHGLLNHYSVTVPVVGDAPDERDRYWSEVLPFANTLDNTLAAGAHAEAMRLERIKLLAADARVPEPIRRIFGRILRDEMMHAQAFAALASEQALKTMLPHHEAGMKMLGLSL